MNNIYSIPYFLFPIGVLDNIKDTAKGDYCNYHLLTLKKQNLKLGNHIKVKLFIRGKIFYKG